MGQGVLELQRKRLRGEKLQCMVQYVYSTPLALPGTGLSYIYGSPPTRSPSQGSKLDQPQAFASALFALLCHMPRRVIDSHNVHHQQKSRCLQKGFTPAGDDPHPRNKKNERRSRVPAQHDVICKINIMSVSMYVDAHFREENVFI